MDNNFKVSVITPVYNAAEFVRRAVEAANAQEEVAEIILVEDGSPDNSLEVCRQLEKEFSKVRLIQHPDKGNHGCGASRNIGIINAKYDYIAFADADNFYLPGRFTMDKMILQDEPDADGVYHCMGNYHYSEESRKKFFESDPSNQEYLTFTKPAQPEELIYVLLGSHPTIKGEFGVDAITIRKRAIEKTGLFNTKLRLQQDVDLWIRLAAKCKLIAGNLTAPVAMRGTHNKQRSTNADEQRKYTLLRLKYLHKWFATHVDDKNVLKTFMSHYYSQNIVLNNKFKGICFFFNYMLKNVDQMKIKYGFFDTHFFALFGRNWLTHKIIYFKNSISSK